MAIRNALHRSKLEDFKSYLSENGFVPLIPKGDFEVLRWKNGKGKPMCIVFNGKSVEHLSCNEAARPLVFEFIKNKEQQ
jgi:hypothetical protein